MAETINDTRLRLETIVQEINPDADISPGSVLSELLVKPNVALQNPIVSLNQDIKATGNVIAALASDEDTINPVIDEIASNYNVIRSTGRQSTGYVKVTVASGSNKSIRANTTFVQPALNLRYVTTSVYNVSANPTDDELQLVPSNGQWYFILPVVAETVGAEYQLSDQTKLSLTGNSIITDYVDSAAYGNFTSGLPVETDKELIARYQEGISHKTLLNTKSILARLREDYPSLQDLSIIGANDVEMTRSKHNLIGISSLGMVDVYLRTAVGVQTTRQELPATKIDSNTWRLTLDNTTLPAFYRLISILPVDGSLGGTLPLISQSYGISNQVGLGNDITTEQEARFTKYQTAVFEFTYESDDPVDTVTLFNVTVNHLPNILDIQDIFLSNEERIQCADYLVKAAHPCFVTLNLKLHKKNSYTEIPVDKVKQDIFNYINTIKFGEDLHVSKIIEICHNYDIKYVDLPISVRGDIYTNTNSSISISATDKLVIPYNPELGITKKTTLFFVDYYNVQSGQLNDSIGIEVI